MEFERIVCINLDSSVKRWVSVTTQIRRMYWPFCEVARFSALTPDNVPEPKPEWFTPTQESWACYQSHLSVIYSAINNKINSLMILEDDVVFDTYFPERARQFFSAIPKDWEVAYLGGVHKSAPFEVHSNYVMCQDTTLHHAWCLRGDGLKKVYKHLTDWDGLKNLKHRKMNKDQWCAEGMRRGLFTAYAPRHRWLVHQAAGYSDRGKRFEREKSTGIRTNRHVRWPSTNPN